MYDDWETRDAEVVAALSARYRFSRANAVQLLRDGRIHHDCGPDLRKSRAKSTREGQK